MDHQFWHNIWTERKIGFHRSDVHPMLTRHWSGIARSSAAVLVPLCGKTLDMAWLAEQGHRVVGVELDERAVSEYFQERQTTPSEQTRTDGLEERHADGVSIVVGDFFRFRPEEPFELFYDRAALVALPEAMRRNYLRFLASLIVEGGQGLLITFEYPEDCMNGPPFSIPRDEVQGQPWFSVETLEREDVIEVYDHLREAGVHYLIETAYRLTRNEHPV
ncbi:thiopurine S-methyltransferase [Halospina denitrificans]|uniref:Thiopurine S-methyltransferase n=1 Tax=Halospina denitrificans TaxID=332522 RepID=A0A4R7K0B4_9GAMM|nr:thiopurine S-methyltransferase [Halospina denitrificans]TDT44272.1 thiopurine S-methyltransferase [Halospina denitrificans]